MNKNFLKPFGTFWSLDTRQDSNDGRRKMWWWVAIKLRREWPLTTRVILLIVIRTALSYAAFAHTGLTPGTERKACMKVFLCCQGHAIYGLWRG